jgi:hypothetical protein
MVSAERREVPIASNQPIDDHGGVEQRYHAQRTHRPEVFWHQADAAEQARRPGVGMTVASSRSTRQAFESENTVALSAECVRPNRVSITACTACGKSLGRSNCRREADDLPDEFAKTRTAANLILA